MPPCGFVLFAGGNEADRCDNLAPPIVAMQRQRPLGNGVHVIRQRDARFEHAGEFGQLGLNDGAGGEEGSGLFGFSSTPRWCSWKSSIVTRRRSANEEGGSAACATRAAASVRPRARAIQGAR